MDQAKAVSRGDHILVQISYSALFCFSYSFIKKSHPQETLPHTLLLGNHPKRTWFQAIYSAIYLVLRASRGASYLLKTGTGTGEDTQRCPETCMEAIWSLPGFCPITHTALPRYFGPDDEEHVGDVLCVGWGDFFFLSHAGAYGEGVPVK